jgi:hypothetical protein
MSILTLLFVFMSLAFGQDIPIYVFSVKDEVYANSLRAQAAKAMKSGNRFSFVVINHILSQKDDPPGYAKFAATIKTRLEKWSAKEKKKRRPGLPIASVSITPFAKGSPSTVWVSFQFGHGDPMHNPEVKVLTAQCSLKDPPEIVAAGIIQAIDGFAIFPNSAPPNLQIITARAHPRAPAVFSF